MWWAHGRRSMFRSKSFGHSSVFTGRAGQEFDGGFGRRERPAAPDRAARPLTKLSGATSHMTTTVEAFSAAPPAVPQVAINDIGTAEDFLAAIDETIKYFNDGDIVEGVIGKVARDEVLLHVGYKAEGVTPARELSIKHDVVPNEVVKVGDAIEALVLQKED